MHCSGLRMLSSAFFSPRPFALHGAGLWSAEDTAQHSHVSQGRGVPLTGSCCVFLQALAAILPAASSAAVTWQPDYAVGVCERSIHLLHLQGPAAQVQLHNDLVSVLLPVQQQVCNNRGTASLTCPGNPRGPAALSCQLRGRGSTTPDPMAALGLGSKEALSTLQKGVNGSPWGRGRVRAQLGSPTGTEPGRIVIAPPHSAPRCQSAWKGGGALPM